MQERALTRTVRRPGRDRHDRGRRLSGTGELTITPFEIVLLSAIMAAGFVAIEQLHQITRSEERETPYRHPPALMIITFTLHGSPIK